MTPDARIVSFFGFAIRKVANIAHYSPESFILRWSEYKYLNIHVGNLDRDVTEEMLRGLFARFGEVEKVTLLHDRHGTSKGLAFIEMPSESEGSSAINGLNRTLFHDRTLDITESQPGGGKRGGNKAKTSPKRPRR